MPAKYTDEQFWAAFWAKTRVEGDCLLWTGKQTKHTVAKGSPRGLVKRHRRWRYAHQVALELKLGRPIAKPLQCNHTCDQSLCINIDHLYEGTQQQNMDDMHARGRWQPHRGEAHPSAKLTEKQVREIRLALKAGSLRITQARLYRVSDQLISAIASGKIWKDIV